MKVELYLSSYATKTELKNATCVDTLSFAKKTDLGQDAKMLRSKILKIKYLILLT